MALLSFGNVALLALGYLIWCVVYQIVYYRFFHPLSQFPGSFWASVTRLWIAYHNIKGDEVAVLQKLHKKYGPVVRITPTMLHVNDATKLPVIYSRNANKSQHYVTGSFGKEESVFNMQDAAVHARFRRIVAAPYSFSNVKKMEPLIDEQIQNWIDKLDEQFACTGDKFDLAPWAVYMAYDVISSIGFGAPFGFIEQGRDVGGLIKGFHDGLVPFGVMARLYPFTKLVKRTFLGKYLVASPEQESGIGALMRFRDRLIEKRLKDIDAGTTNGRIDILQTFLEARDDNGKPLPLDYIKAEILLVLIAGADTTGTAFLAVMQHILAHPSVFDKVLAEIDAATRQGRLPAPGTIPAYDQVLAHCPYYIACVREAMRVTPAAPTIFPRLAPHPGGLVLYGKHVPAGTELTCNPWLVHRDTRVYGPDADVFLPERWLDDGPEKAAEYARYNMAFGYGARVCLGKDIAYMELFKAPLHFLRSFRLTVLNEQRPARYLVKGGVSYFEDMWVTIERRAPVV
ncbi:flavonoid 3',5'-hydroxylase [Achaetomium macrosporum]|uniref:Flavonoid 3',5'-hydroxylase n=1 Tax=Achaetomium macrosporum TaxID=79813 RepID=A0AAN7C0Q9_9PEZI|nr:flavonoid 3',5'-hydroxylase [Achaetomium macrosporum]